MRTTHKLIGLAVALTALMPAAFAFAATDDYTNYWSFDEGGGRSVNDSIGGQNGVLVGTSTGFGWASGKVGTALGMDGTPGTGVALPDGFLKGSQGSISVWVNAQQLNGHNIIFSGKSTSDNNIYAFFGIDIDGRPTLQYRDSTNGNDNKAQGTTLLSANQWYNIVLTTNSQTYQMFVNGQQVNVAGNNLGRWFPDMTNQTFSYRIGTIDASPISGSWNGYIDDLKIYSRALTQDEVTTLYNTSNALRPTLPTAIAPKIVFSTSDDHIPFGGSVALNWTTTNVDSCSLNMDPTVTATSGSKVYVHLAQNTDYKLTCAGKYGPTDSTIHIFVGSSTPTTSTSTGTLTVTPILPPTPTFSFTRNLTVGSRGDDVTALQNYLINKGYLATTPTGYFGGLTKAALAKFQKEHQLPSTGYFGAMTRALLAQGN